MADIKLNLNCYETLGHDEPWSLQTYQKIGGYEAWQRILKEKITPADVVEEIKSSAKTKINRRR